MKKLWRDVVAIFIFVLVVGIFFYPTLLQNKLPVPSDTLVGLYHPWRDFFDDTYHRGVPFKNFLVTDPVRQEIPWRQIAINEWKKGLVPFWNPFSFSGTSLAANIQAGVFYPLNAIFFLLDFSIAWSVLIMLQPLLAGVFLYFYLRHHQISETAGLLGALFWSFSGFSIAWLTWGTIVHVALWLPLILLSIDHLVESKIKSFLSLPVITWFALFVLSLTFQFLAGHAQIAAYVFIFSFAYALWQLHTKFPKRINIPWWLFSGILFSMVFTSFQWVPLIRSVLESGRVLESDLWNKSGWFLPWQNTIQFLIPDFFGNPSTLNYWGEWNYGEFISYIGVAGAIGVFLSFVYVRQYLFWMVSLFVTLLFLLPTPIAKLPFIIHIPFIQSLQPTRLMVIVDFIVSVLAAYGFDRFYKSKEKKSWFGIIVLVIIFLLSWTIVFWQLLNQNDTVALSHWVVTKRNMVLPTAIFSSLCIVLIFSKIKIFRNLSTFTKMAIVALTVFDLLRFGWKYTPFTSPSYFFPETKTLSFLKSQPEPFRIASIDKELLPPNTASMYGIEDINGYDPLYSSRYEEYFAAMNRGEPDIRGPFGFNRILTLERFDTLLLPLLNVRYILSLHDLHYPYLSEVFRERETRVYQDARSLPRAYFVNQVHVASEKRDSIHALFSDSFQSSKTALVEIPLTIGTSPLSDKDRVIITTYDQSEMDVTVSAADTRLLVISNIWSPFWTATVDSKDVPILRTDYTFQGIVIENGDHKIRLTTSL